MKTTAIVTTMLLATLTLGSSVGWAEKENDCAPAAMSFSEYLSTVPAVLELEPRTTFGEIWPQVAPTAAPAAFTPGTACEARCLAGFQRLVSSCREALSVEPPQTLAGRFVACLAACVPRA